ncbi:hypothetical protein LTR85_005523 [Meristemomyces frigidus]|nr:hypothetical protein LTR85_005523 [Meristemomyces frigidus]
MASPPPSTEPCRLLKLPPELRNRIYELVSTPEHDNGVGFALATATGPSKALLLSCRQVYSEACIIHKLAFRRYWQTSTFVLDQRFTCVDLAQIAARGEKNVNAISDLILLFHDSRFNGTLLQVTPVHHEMECVVVRKLGRWNAVDYRSMAGSMWSQRIDDVESGLPRGSMLKVPMFEQVVFWSILIGRQV